ncbi:MAG: HPr family phosphocarrier protein [Desulfitobacteriaceae bacterium]
MQKDNRKVNAKSIIGVLSLGVTKGTEIVVSAEGNDEEFVVSSLIDLIKSKFSEE